jgi:hypothetical protein
LVSTWDTPCRKASSSHSDWLFADAGDDGQSGGAAAQPFDDPDALGAHQVNVENARGGETVREQRFGFINPEAVDDTVLLRIQTGADCFREIRMSGQNQNGFHQFLHRDQTLPKARHALKSFHNLCQQVNGNLKRPAPAFFAGSIAKSVKRC